MTSHYHFINLSNLQMCGKSKSQDEQSITLNTQLDYQTLVEVPINFILIFSEGD